MLQKTPIHLPRQFRKRVVQIDDLVEPRPEKIVLSTVWPLIRKHRNLRLKASSETGNHSDSIKSICKEIDVDTPETGDIEYLQNSKTHCGANSSEFFTGDELKFYPDQPMGAGQTINKSERRSCTTLHAVAHSARPIRFE